MTATPPGAFAANLLEFIRLLRRAGLPVGPADMLRAVEAVAIVGVGSRTDLHAALSAATVRRHDQAEVFDAAFDLFWRDLAAEAAMAFMDEPGQPDAKPPPGSRRAAEAFADRQRDRAEDASSRHDAALTVSETERLNTMDFEAMSAGDIAAARQTIRTLRLPLDTRRTRRSRPSPRGTRVDMAATLRLMSRQGGAMTGLVYARPVERPPPLVVLCDISGSMARYAQVLMHFLHAVTNDRDRVSVFLFGTRLTNVTRLLRHADPETALAAVAAQVPDWSGGTRIGATLEQFNREWGKRVLGQGAVVLLVTDGLDRAGADGLPEAMERLHKSCRRLVWLNPLLRWDGFQPRSQGIRAMLPHVDEFRPVHNIASLRALIEALSRPAPTRRRATSEDLAA